ncbi:hypothetical protein MKI88_10280 [Sphingomonas sp. LaA6.9]|nr:hypothetical protein [Sphingomonas sp. LaA6.9]MCJ8157787.1 hypothetical protein [Sphingomonas sp. LaA6.9]
MTRIPYGLQPLTSPGIASAEGGLVVLDGPDGVAITMTPDAAARTGHSLITAAVIAEQYCAERKPDA